MIQRSMRWMVCFTAAVAALAAGCGSSGGDGGPGAAATVTVSIAAGTVEQGGFTTRATASVRDAAGEPIAASVSWSSSDASVATVAADGTVTSGAIGSAQITATAAPGVAGSVTVSVVQQPNPRCAVPGAPATPGAIAAAPTFGVSPNGFDAIPAIPYDTRFLVAVDADGDGDQDLLNLDSSAAPPAAGTTFVYRNDGAGHFGDGTASVLAGAAVPADQPSSSEVADLNGDGVPDTFITQAGQGDSGARSLLLASSGGGTVAESGDTLLTPNASGSVTKASAAADLDCDGDVDLVQSAIGPSGLTTVFVNDGSGHFQGDATRVPAELVNGAASFTALAACDVDRDGDVDMIGGGWNGSSLGRDALLLNDGFGNFRLAPVGALPAWHFPAGSNVTTAVRCADLDQDGYPDLAVAQTENFATGRVVTYHNQRDRSFAAVDSAAIEWPAGFPSSVWATDFNGDGWPDVLVSGFNSAASTRLYSNAGTSGFTEVTPPRADQPLTPIQADGDGRLDLVAPETAGAPTLMLNGDAEEPPPARYFKTTQAGDRLEIPLGPSSAASGHFHFEARGFVDDFKPRYSPDTLFIYFWLYSGDNFYYKGAGEGFLYIPSQYAMTNYWCNYGKVRGRSNHPGEWPLEDCYQYDPWDGQKWYSFDIRWDGSNISIDIDGKRKHAGSYGSNTLPLIAGFGFPPADVEEQGIVGMEFRNWIFTQD